MNKSVSRGPRFLPLRTPRRAAALVLAGTLVAAATTITSPPSTAAPTAVKAAASRGTLDVTPSVHVAGQAVRFHGNLGRPGQRAIHLQSHMNRPGDVWKDVPRTTFRTNSRGAFSFVFPAPSMFKISYRVVGGGMATRGYLFNARPQEITLGLPGSDPLEPLHTVAPALPFTVVADTTPPVRPALGTPPAIPGRTVLLQERVGTGWRTIDSGTTDDEGHVRFQVTAPLSGQRVLRARQQRYLVGKNAIGWYASFPAYFSTPGAGPDIGDAPSSKVAPPLVATSPFRPTASGNHGWGAALWDFDWERGQDLDSRPSRGKRLRGTWVDTSDGTGRATPFNGALVLQSKLSHKGAGDFGTTTATLRGNSQAHGRWEFRLQGHVFEQGARPYRFLLELVPVGAPLVTCSPESIVVADYLMGAPGMTMAVRSQEAGSVWTRRAGDIRFNNLAFNVAVEVGRRHVTWFREGRPIATVKDARAQLHANLVPRLSLVGAQQEMNGSEVDSDWQRAWTLDRGRQVKWGAPLTRAPYSSTC